MSTLKVRRNNVKPNAAIPLLFKINTYSSFKNNCTLTRTNGVKYQYQKIAALFA